MRRSNGGTPTILVVDDEEAILHLLEHALSCAGFVVLTAGTGEAAIEVYRSRDDIDLVLLDVRMPAPWDGPHTLHELQRVCPAVRVAFMSGWTGEYTTDDLLALGALRVFDKPFPNLTDLAAALTKLISTERTTFDEGFPPPN